MVVAGGAREQALVARVELGGYQLGRLGEDILEAAAQLFQ